MDAITTKEIILSEHTKDELYKVMLVEFDNGDDPSKNKWVCQFDTTTAKSVKVFECYNKYLAKRLFHNYLDLCNGVTTLRGGV